MNRCLDARQASSELEPILAALAARLVPLRSASLPLSGGITNRPNTEPACGAAYGRPVDPHGLLPCGYRAIDSLLLEKGYRVRAADITPDDTPLEAGPGFCVRQDKRFLGSDALGEPARRLRCITLEDPRSVALGNEPVRAGGRVCGRVRTGGYGYTVERSIALAYLPATFEVGTGVEIDIFGTWVPGEVAAEPLLDSSGRSGSGSLWGSGGPGLSGAARLRAQ